MQEHPTWPIRQHYQPHLRRMPASLIPCCSTLPLSPPIRTLYSVYRTVLALSGLIARINSLPSSSLSLSLSLPFIHSFFFLASAGCFLIFPLLPICRLFSSRPFGVHLVCLLCIGPSIRFYCSFILHVYWDLKVFLASGTIFG